MYGGSGTSPSELPVEPKKPAPVAERLHELDRPEALARAEPARRSRQPLPEAVRTFLDEKHLDEPAGRAPKREAGTNHSRVVDDRQLVAQADRAARRTTRCSIDRGPRGGRRAAANRPVEPSAAVRSTPPEARSRGEQCPSGAESSLVAHGCTRSGTCPTAHRRCRCASPRARADRGHARTLPPADRSPRRGCRRARSVGPGSGRCRRSRRAPHRGAPGRAAHRRDTRPPQPDDPAVGADRGRASRGATCARGRPRAPRRPRQLGLAWNRHAARPPREAERTRTRTSPPSTGTAARRTASTRSSGTQQPPSGR